MATDKKNSASRGSQLTLQHPMFFNIVLYDLIILSINWSQEIGNFLSQMNHLDLGHFTIQLLVSLEGNNSKGVIFSI